MYFGYSSRDNLPSTVKFGTNSAYKVENTYDELTRLSEKQYTVVGESAALKTAYSYLDFNNGKRTTGTVNGVSYTYASGGLEMVKNRSYAYDKTGNITKESQSGTVAESYTYDNKNQLTEHDSATQKKKFTYTYDAAGNILSKTEYDKEDGTTKTVEYGYDDSTWHDLLTSYDGQAIEYDAIGNPTTYLGWAMTWQGRQLARALKDGKSLSFTYDSDGIRTSKTVGTVKTSYLLNGTQILAQTTNGKTLCFFYDQQGNRVAMADSSNHIYYYLYNLQGDVIALADASTGKLAATYTYDAWGKIVEINDQVPEDVAETSIAKINPFRYRGYYYDTETELYYLNSRYYDAETGRFINADNAITGAGGDVRGYNLFSYCINDPVNMSDPTGHWPKLSTIFAVVAVAAVAVAAVATCGAAVPALAVAGGGIIGGISAGAVSTAASVATGAMIVAGVSTTAAVTSAVAEKASNKTAKRNNSVYVLKDDTGTVQYVGRTNNVDRRRAAHSANPARTGLEMEVIASGLNLPESRALEQAGMAYYHTINTANKVNNQINSVSPKYWGAFKELALGTLNYGWNQMSNEILYWTGS